MINLLILYVVLSYAIQALAILAIYWNALDEIDYKVGMQFIFAPITVWITLLVFILSVLAWTLFGIVRVFNFIWERILLWLMKRK